MLTGNRRNGNITEVNINIHLRSLQPTTYVSNEYLGRYLEYS